MSFFHKGPDGRSFRLYMPRDKNQGCNVGKREYTYDENKYSCIFLPNSKYNINGT